MSVLNKACALLLAPFLTACSLSASDSTVPLSLDTTVTFTLTPGSIAFICGDDGCQSPLEVAVSFGGFIPAELQQVDIDGNKISVVAQLNDQGINGDTTAVDGIFGGQVIINESSSTLLRFYGPGADQIEIAAGTVLSSSDLMTEGQTQYSSNCASCHGSNGAGIGQFPVLAGNTVVTNESVHTLMTLVSNGVSGSAMSAYANVFTDQEFAGLMTYIRNSFGNDMGDTVYPSDVSYFRGL